MNGGEKRKTSNMYIQTKTHSVTQKQLKFCNEKNRKKFQGKKKQKKKKMF